MQPKMPGGSAGALRFKERGANRLKAAATVDQGYRPSGDASGIRRYACAGFAAGRGTGDSYPLESTKIRGRTAGVVMCAATMAGAEQVQAMTAAAAGDIALFDPRLIGAAVAARRLGTGRLHAIHGDPTELLVPGCQGAIGWRCTGSVA